MIIKKAQFVTGIVKGKASWAPHIPQVIFYGRSNAGKSSTINALVNRTIAKPSGTPGKTQEINLFNINDKIYLLDLPGYGYAKVSKTKKDKLQELIFWFMLETQTDKRTNVIILDAKVGLTDFDRQMLEHLYTVDQPIIVILNKCDKLKQNDISKAVRHVQQEVAGFVDVLPFSARTKRGIEQFWKVIGSKNI